MKKITLFLMAFVAMAVNAKTVEKTVWEGSEAISWNTEVCPGTQYETPSGTFTGLAKDNVVKIYTTTTYEDPNYVVTYKKGNEWSWTDLTTTITEGVISFTVADDTQATEIAERELILRGQAWTATKITVTTEEADDPVDEGTPTELWSGTHDLASWSGLDLSGDTYKTILVNAKVGDILKVTYTSDEAGDINFCNGNGWATLTDGSFSVSTTDVSTNVEYEIVDATNLEYIQYNGLAINGTNAVISKIELLTYASSYDAVAVTIGNDGIATFSSSKHLDFAGTGVTPYYASAVTKGTVTLTSTTTTWSWQGYILKGSANTYTVPVTAEANAYYPSTNYLNQMANGGTVAASTESTFRYIFAKKKEGDANIGFYKLTDDHTLGAKKAYLETETDITPTSGARLALIFDDGTITGITDLKHAVNDGIFYNMNGMRVERPAKGLFIRNGKKIIIK